MLISISGTPGTGKTSVAKELQKILHANMISIHSLLVRKKIPYKYDRKRRTKIISIKDLKNAAKKEVRKEKLNIAEGHLAHLLPADLVIILRCQPDILIKRMKKKGWRKSKIIENTQAEILDTITIEALGANKKNKIIEIDVTKRKPAETARLIKKLLNNYRLQKKYSAGKIDWSERFVKYLIIK